MNVFEALTNNCIIHPKQGYAFYFFHKGKEYKKCYSKLSDDLSKEIDFDSCFRLASVSKQFIAYAIVDLVNKGLINYDTKISEIYPDLPEYFNKISIKNLLNHTSGIYDYEDMPHSDKQIVDEDILDFLMKTKRTYFESGTKYQYSNTAYILLGLIISKVSKRSISEYIQVNIFEKAKMESSYVNIEGKTEIKNRAMGHIVDEEGNLKVKDQYWCSATIGDGGIYSTVNDLLKWCKFLVNSKYYFEMTDANYINENEYNEYAKGLRVIKYNNSEIIYHCGSTIGTRTLLLFSKDLNLCLVFLSNIDYIDTAVIKDNLLNYLDKQK